MPEFTIEPAKNPVKVMFNGETVSDGSDAVVMRELNHQPVYYFPRSSINMELLHRTEHSSH